MPLVSALKLVLSLAHRAALVRGTTVVSARTVMLAALVKRLHAPITSTEYRPLSATVALLMMSDGVVMMSCPLRRQE